MIQESLRTLAVELSKALTIEAPSENERVTVAVYDEMRGQLAAAVPEGFGLRVLTQDRYNYFLMHPPTQVIFATGRWAQSNVRLATPGAWKLHVCLANQKGSDWFDARARASDWSGFPDLPPGTEIIGSVQVKWE